MRNATALTLIAVGAILTFAVTAHLGFLNLQVAGVVIMIVGLAGMLVRRRGVEWTRRRIVTRSGARGPVVSQVEDTSFPSYVMIDPASLESVQPTTVADDLAPPVIVDDIEPPVTDDPAADDLAGRPHATRRPAAQDETVVQEFVAE
jgi:hypothetical protein